jgi:Domain of unknown function (DUF6431)
MIIDFSVSYKDYSKKILNYYGIWEYECPVCKAKRQWNRHASYSRYLLFLEENMFLEEELAVLRLLCKSCGHTHAVLPQECIPFQLYSIYSVATVLHSFYQTDSCKKVCDSFQIPWQLLYLFIRTLDTYLASIELLLRKEQLWSHARTPSKAQVTLFLTDKGHLLFAAFFHSFRTILFHRRKSTVAYSFYIGT